MSTQDPPKKIHITEITISTAKQKETSCIHLVLKSHLLPNQQINKKNQNERSWNEDPSMHSFAYLCVRLTPSNARFLQIHYLSKYLHIVSAAHNSAWLSTHPFFCPFYCSPAWTRENEESNQLQTQELAQNPGVVKQNLKDAGNRSSNHYKKRLFAAPLLFAPEMLASSAKRKRPCLEKIQQRYRNRALDIYFAWTANLASHTFYVLMLPLLL